MRSLIYSITCISAVLIGVFFIYAIGIVFFTIAEQVFMIPLF
jgi:hypothetical protein